MNPELVGYDPELVGFSLPNLASMLNRVRAPSSALSRYNPPAPRMPVTQGRFLQPSNQSIQVFGLGTLSVGAGGTGTLSAVVQKGIQPKRLVITTTAATGELTVTDVKVGTRSQLAGVSAAPAEMFGATTTDPAVLFDAAGSGITISVDVASSAAGAVTVAAAFYCYAAQ